jgi:hypothetical protein
LQARDSRATASALSPRRSARAPDRNEPRRTFEVNRDGRQPPRQNREEPIVGFEDAKADIKKTMREADETAKETWRKADGEESVPDKVANLGDDIRKELGNAGDDLRRNVDKLDDDVEDRPV